MPLVVETVQAKAPVVEQKTNGRDPPPGDEESVRFHPFPSLIFPREPYQAHSYVFPKPLFIINLRPSPLLCQSSHEGRKSPKQKKNIAKKETQRPFTGGSTSVRGECHTKIENRSLPTKQSLVMFSLSFSLSFALYQRFFSEKKNRNTHYFA